MYNPDEITIEEWPAAVPDGAPELLAHNFVFGELKTSLLFWDGAGNIAFEMLAAPTWFCNFSDERQQTGLLQRGRNCGVEGSFMKIIDSPFVEQMKNSEPLFALPKVELSHWVVLGTEACCHIVSESEPRFRKVF